MNEKILYADQKRQTRTNPIVRLNNLVFHGFRKHCKKTELGSNTGTTGNKHQQNRPKKIKQDVTFQSTP